MSGAGNTASGSTIYSENTTAGGPNDVTVANLRVQQDMRVDGNFEVGTFSIDDLTVNDDLNVTDELTVGGNTYAQYLEADLDINCHGDVLIDQTIVCAGLANLNGGADMPPTKRLRVGNSTINAEVNETDVTVTDASGEGSLFHNRIHISDPTNTHVARVRLNGSTMEVGPSTATTLALQTGGTTRATVNASTGQVAVTNGIASSSTTTGALVVTGGAGVSGDVYVGQNLRVLATTGSSSTTTGAITVPGGVGVMGKINAGNDISTNGSLIALQNATITGTLNWGATGRPVATRLTAQTLSGASIEFTSIPSTVDTIEVYFYGLSSNVTNFYPKIEIGTANLAGYQTTNYAATAWRDGFNDDFTTHIPMFTNSALSAAGDNFSGMLRIRYVYGSNPLGYFYAFDGSSRLNSSTIRGCCIVGSLFTASTAGANTFIDRIRISPSAGTFDGGTANVLYY